MLAFLQNEAELAGVLAHEIGELQYSEITVQANQKVQNGLVQASAVAAPFFGGIGALAFLGIMGVNAAANGEKTKEERVWMADKLALQYLVANGYDPQGWLDVLYRIVNLEMQDIYLVADYYDYRPINVARMTRLRKAFRKLALDRKTLSTYPDIYLAQTRPVLDLYPKKAEAPLMPNVTNDGMVKPA
jgi:predicted Zn-dependent protease